MIVRIRLGTGRPIQRKLGKNRHLALACGACREVSVVMVRDDDPGRRGIAVTCCVATTTRSVPVSHTLSQSGQQGRKLDRPSRGAGPTVLPADLE